MHSAVLSMFPARAPEPYRLDFFGDELETIRTFDPMSQRTTGNEEAFALGPVSEIAFDDASNERFREGYDGFWPTVRPRPLYEAVGAGAHHPGVEHWLPLFHERISTLFYYVPDAIMSLDTRQRKLSALVSSDRGFLRCSVEMMPSNVRDANQETPVYRPLPKDALSN